MLHFTVYEVWNHLHVSSFCDFSYVDRVRATVHTVSRHLLLTVWPSTLVIRVCRSFSQEQSMISWPLIENTPLHGCFWSEEQHLYTHTHTHVHSLPCWLYIAVWDAGQLLRWPNSPWKGAKKFSYRRQVTLDVRGSHKHVSFSRLCDLLMYEYMNSSSAPRICWDFMWSKEFSLKLFTHTNQLIDEHMQASTVWSVFKCTRSVADKSIRNICLSVYTEYISELQSMYTATLDANYVVNKRLITINRSAYCNVYCAKVCPLAPVGLCQQAMCRAERKLTLLTSWHVQSSLWNTAGCFTAHCILTSVIIINIII